TGMRLAALVGCVVMVAGLVAGAAPAAASGCVPVVQFGIGGNGDPRGDIYKPPVRPIWYPAEIFPIGLTTYDDAVRIGRDNMLRAVYEYAERCPGQIVVRGYSQGARSAGDALEVLQEGPLRHRVSGVLYSDPKNPGGIEDALYPLSVMGATFTGPRRGFTVPVRVHCNPHDAPCDFPIRTDPVRAAM